MRHLCDVYVETRSAYDMYAIFDVHCICHVCNVEYDINAMYYRHGRSYELDMLDSARVIMNTMHTAYIMYLGITYML